MPESKMGTKLLFRASLTCLHCKASPRNQCKNIIIVTIEQELIAGKVVLLVSGRMDAENAPQFEQKCRASIAEGSTVLVVDLGDLAYVSSLGLRSFISVAKMLQAKGGALRICRLTGFVRQVFEITGLLPVFGVYESVEAALTAG